MDPVSIAIGLVWMVVLGAAVGNYACSVVYRLPRGKTPFERHPFCGHCNTDLKPIDLFPIVSWVMTRGRCRYCGGTIPAVYTVIELVCGVVFIAYFLRFGVSEQFLLYTAYAVFVVILAAIHWQQRWIAATIYSYALACVALVRVLQEHTIYGFIQSGFTMLVIMLAFWRVARIVAPGRQRELPEQTLLEEAIPSYVGTQSAFSKPWIWWFTLLGALVPFEQWRFILPIYVMKFFVPKSGRVVVYAAGALVLPLVI